VKTGAENTDGDLSDWSNTRQTLITEKLKQKQNVFDLT
jgi:hypothetical protein